MDNREKTAQRVREWFRRNKDKAVHYQNVRRARKLAAPCDPNVDPEEIRVAQRNRCFYCYEDMTDKKATVEHIQPLSRGGGHTTDNIAIACLSCNSTKKDRTLREFYRDREMLYGEPPVCPWP